jgi:hypothetical protein
MHSIFPFQLFLRSPKSKKFKSKNQTLEILIRLKDQVETNTSSRSKNPMILTVGLVKILCDGDINTKFFEKCQILFTSQHNLHEENLDNQDRMKILIPSKKSFYNRTIVPEIFVIIFHLGHEAQPPPSIAHNALQTMKSRQNSSQCFVAELLPHQFFRNSRCKPYPFFQARKSFNPIVTNKLYEIQLKIPIKKATRGRKSVSNKNSNSAGGGFLAEQDFEFTMKWCEKDGTSTKTAQQDESTKQQPLHPNSPFSRIFYHFTTKNGSPKVETHQSIQCPWCRYPHRHSQLQSTMTSTLPHDSEHSLYIQASPAQCNAILTWSNLEFAGGTPYLPLNNNGGGTKSKSAKRKLDQSNHQNHADTEYFQFPSSVIWSPSIRQSMRSLFIHLNTFHSHFQYQYFCDRLLNIHIIISRNQSPQCVLSSDLLNNPISPPTVGSRRASPISISSSSSASMNNSSRSAYAIPEHAGNFLFYGKNWRNLFSDDFPILLVKSLNCDHAAITTRSISSSSTETIDQHSSLIPRSETISLIENSYLLQEELKPMTSTSPTTTSLQAPPPPLISSSLLHHEDIDCPLTSSNLMTRQYFHSNGFPIEPTEGQYDSDNDIKTTWEHVHSYDLIEEFQDICHLEKKFMIIWNTFINSFPIYADRYMCVALEIFAKRFGFYILQHGLRHIFLLHLMTLWDFSLVTFNAIVKSLEIVDQCHEKCLQYQQRTTGDKDNENKSLEL